jgi:hypothetical protein
MFIKKVNVLHDESVSTDQEIYMYREVSKGNRENSFDDVWHYFEDLCS